MPSWPSPLKPQHLRLPPVTSAHAWKSPKAMASTDMPDSEGQEGTERGQVTFRGLQLACPWLCKPAGPHPSLAIQSSLPAKLSTSMCVRE
jgi:hypothetical protein